MSGADVQTLLHRLRSSVPDVLQALPHWLVWKRIEGRKVPYYVNGSARSGPQGQAADRERLASFSQTLEALSGGSYTGVGLAILPDTDIVAMDFDDVVSQGSVIPEVASAVAQTYAEFSPSGQGIRAFFAGKYASRKSHARDGFPFTVELFGDSGFVTVTGDVLPLHLSNGWLQAVPITEPMRALIHERWRDVGRSAQESGEDDLLSLVPKLPLTEEQARRFVMQLPADCPYDEWFRVAAALHHQFDGNSVGLSIFRDWSLTSPRPATERELLQKWNSLGNYRGDPVTMASVLKAVAHQRLTPDEVLQRLRAMPRSCAESNWALLAAALEDGVEEVVTGMHQLLGKNLKTLRAELSRAVEARLLDSDVDLPVRRARDGRRLFMYVPHDRVRLAQKIEREVLAKCRVEDYMVFGGTLAQILVQPGYTGVKDAAGVPPQLQIERLDDVAVLQRVEKVAAIEVFSEGSLKKVAVPKSLVDILLKKKNHSAPQVHGLVSHPLVLADGRIACGEGYDSETGLFSTARQISDLRPYTENEATAALERIRTTLFSEFEFASELDALVAVAALFTGVQRRLMRMAPGFAILANTQSSGKTTLARLIHITLSGHEMPVHSFPLDEVEARKTLHSTLMQSPATVVFDNIPDGFTFRSSVVAVAITSPILRQRILGESREVACSTNSLFMLTGNNLSLGADEVTRFLICRLQPQSVRPEERKFKNSDVLEFGRKVRNQVLRDVVGIIAGYMNARCPNVTSSGTRFPEWDSMVRAPLAWSSGADVADVFRKNESESEELGALRALLAALSLMFEGREFTAAEVARAVVFNDSDQVRTTLAEALAALRLKDVSSTVSIGRVLKARVGKPAAVDIAGRCWTARLRSRLNGNHSASYRVELTSQLIDGVPS